MTTLPNHPDHFRSVTSRLLIATITVCLVFIAQSRPATAHGAPIIDGLYTGDWCAPATVGIYGPDTFTLLNPASLPIPCLLGSEIFWDDWDAATYGGGAADTIGYLVGGVPGGPGVPGLPLPDGEVDLEFFATTADAMTVFFTVATGSFPAATGVPPHIQIAIDIDGPVTGNPFWYDPLAVGTAPLGIAAIPPPGLAPDYLITTDGPAGMGFLWEATSAPGAWTLVGPIPFAWSGPTVAPAPGVFEFAVPWGMFAPGPLFAPGMPAFMTLMVTHGLASAPPPAVADAPMTPPDDVISEPGLIPIATTSPDICPIGPPSTDCEVFVAPVSLMVSTDAFITVLHPTANLAITKTSGITGAIPGTQVVYTITASNPNGPSTANGALVADTFPAPLTSCTWVCSGSGGGTCTASGSGNISDGVTLPTGGSVTYTASCSLPTTATGSLANTATITPADVIDVALADNTATDTIPILELDYGDAPDPTYPTLLASNGARHAITGPFLGVSIDGELDGQPTATASGDDNDGNDDEDGVSFTSAVVAGQLSSLSVTTSGAGLLDAWIDLNDDGDWADPGEQFYAGLALAAGVNALGFTPAASSPASSTFVRFRFSQNGGLAPTGLAVDGEVEDHPVTVTRSADLAMSLSDSADPAAAGLGLRYTLSATNNGPSDASGVTVTTSVPTSTSFLGTVPGSPTCTHSSGTVTCNLGTIASGAGSDVILTVLVSPAATGSLSATGSVNATEPDPVSGNDSGSEATSVVTPLFADAFETGDTTGWTRSVP